MSERMYADEAAEILGVTVEMVRRLAKAYGLEHDRKGGAGNGPLIFTREYVETYGRARGYIPCDDVVSPYRFVCPICNASPHCACRAASGRPVVFHGRRARLASSPPRPRR